MGKIQVFLPTEEMAEMTVSLIEREHIDGCRSELLKTENSLQAARAAIEDGASVIVARGAQAATIKEYTNIPLIEIKLTAQELGILIKEAKRLVDTERPKIAFLGYSSMFPNTRYMNDIFDVDLRVYTFEKHDEIEGTVYRAMIDGAQVICGGESALEFASHYDVKTVFLNATEDSIRAAIQVAQTVIRTMDAKKENEAQFVTVMDAVYSGVISVDINRIVKNANHTIQQILNIEEKRLLGKTLDQVLPELEVDYVDKVLSGKRDVLNTTFRMGQENYMVSIVPIIVSGDEIIGAIISMGAIGGLGREKKSENFFSGYLASGGFSKIHTQSERMKQCIELARTYALSNNPVIIYGETGTEKETFAQGIHNNSAQKNSHFITFNCSGLSEQQQLDTLFGNEEKEGAIVQAAHGTLMIRDIDELYPICQYRLVRALRYKVFMKTDIVSVPAVDFRLIATSRVELGKKVITGDFRQDLYYILNAFSLRLPSLRERKEDIPDLVNSYLKKGNRKYYKRVTLTHGGMDEMVQANWEGNILQLENFCEHLVLTAPKRNVDEVAISKMLSELYPVFRLEDKPIQEEKRLEPSEAILIRKSLIENSGSRQKTAEAMGISTATLWRKIKKYGIVE